MLTLTQKTAQEARTMKTITFIALIYLPASFTSVRTFFYKHLPNAKTLNVKPQTFLSMGFVHVESLQGVMRLSVSKDMLFYIVITLPLMASTVLGWWLWECMLNRRGQAGMNDYDEEKVKNV